MFFMFDKYVFILDIKNIPYNALFLKWKNINLFIMILKLTDQITQV